jgi:hypothetical protein
VKGQEWSASADNPETGRSVPVGKDGEPVGATAVHLADGTSMLLAYYARCTCCPAFERFFSPAARGVWASYHDVMRDHEPELTTEAWDFVSPPQWTTDDYLRFMEAANDGPGFLATVALTAMAHRPVLVCHWWPTVELAVEHLLWCVDSMDDTLPTPDQLKAVGEALRGGTPSAVAFGACSGGTYATEAYTFTVAPAPPDSDPGPEPGGVPAVRTG